MRWTGIGCLFSALALAGCSGGGGGSPAVVGGTTVRADATASAFFVRDGLMWPSGRWGTSGQPMMRTLLGALVRGPSTAERAQGVRSLLPVGTRVLGLRLDGTGPFTGTIVNLSSEFAAGGSTSDMQLRVAQVVFTIAGSAGDYHGIEVEIEGKPQTVATPDGGYKRWVRRVDFASLMPAGWTPASPRIGQRIPAGTTQFWGYYGKGPLRQHMASVALSVRIVGAMGRVLARSSGGIGEGPLGVCCDGVQLRLPSVRRPERVTVQVVMAPSWWPEHRRVATTYPVWVVPKEGPA